MSASSETTLPSSFHVPVFRREMSEDLSPAAQFAAAAAAEAASASATVASAEVVEAVAPEPVVPAPLDHSLDQSAADKKSAADPISGTAYAAAARPDYTPAEETVPDSEADEVHHETPVAHVSAAAVFESAVDSAVASTSGNDSDRGETGSQQPALQKQPAVAKVISLADEELFPALGSSNKTTTSTAWGARTGPQSIADKVRQNRSTEVVDLPMMSEPIGEAVRKIMERTKTRIEVSHNRGLKTSTYLVSGKPEAVAKARREICSKLSPQITHVIQVPALARAQIAGVRGRTLLGIQAQTHTTITLPKRGNIVAAKGGEDGLLETLDVSITGDQGGVVAAAAQIEAIVDKRTTRRAIRVTDVPRDAIALLVGKDGATLQALQQAHPLVQITVPGPVDSDQAIGLVGERDAVQTAATAVRDTAQKLMQSSQTVTVTVPKRQHRFVVGPNGQALAEIARATGCSVSVPSPRSASDQVIVRGPEANLVQALGLVMAKANSVTVETIDPCSIHACTHPVLYARRALQYLHDRNRFRRIEAEHGVTLRVPSVDVVSQAQTTEKLLIEIEGRDARTVTLAHEAVTQLFAALPPFHFNSIDVEPHLHALLIGRDGSNIARLQAARSVYVLFPHDATSRDVLVVYEGFNPDIDIITDAAARERATRELLRKTLEEFRTTIQSDASVTTQLVAVPTELQLQLSKPDASAALLHAAGVSKSDVSRVALRFGSAVDAADHGSTRVHRRGDKQLAETDVEVKGLASAVKLVAAELRKRVTAAADYERLHSYRDQITVPRALLARIIGRGGENIRRIRSEHDVTVDVTDGAAGAPSLVKLQGTREDVTAVVGELNELAARMADQVSEIVNVPARLHRSLIGTGGKYVRRLEEKYAVSVQFPSSRRESSDDDPQLTPDQILIRGGRKGVESTKVELLELAAYETEHNHTVRFTIPSVYLPHVVGKAGSRIGEIKDESNTRIDLGDPKDGVVEAVIVGTVAGTKLAREAIETIVTEQQSQIETTLSVPVKYHRVLIGSGGSHVRELVQQAGGDPDIMSGAGACRVNFPRASENTDQVKLKGDSKVVEAVKKRIVELVAERERMTTITVSIPVTQHAFIIGRGGSHLKEMQEKHSVEIHFRSKANRASDSEDPNSVRITGLPENCDACKTALQALVRDEKSISVPLALHQRFGGRNGPLWRRLRNAFDVQVDTARIDKAPVQKVDESNDSSDDSATVVYRDPAAGLSGLTAEWILRGEEAKLAKAVDLINSEIENAEPGVEARIRIDPRFHRHIIGKQGATIAKIRAATECEIAVPKRGNNSHWVSVTGTRANVDLAMELIDEAIEERD
ncbi:hypothetical protein COEREDRAFT_82773 [Coemansia reversa NRRL 1564]|uniref:K Homology domain-containing protein n=1 Tax=Coemansia reversa (strain ATCC 12441 / NRRL 1564) TaxID=763665 RepID=A0A2G5B6L0_COERN|nr:hypothetical protein COEREDRAFT_82773 [Coemansia reversa NRRL 1564]|eukprot:PIA14357.1 hypothetical protein COEREDRAFT_82773 [Coemansia reversa NRRL 1564]